MINYNENEAEKEKQIRYIRHKQTQAYGHEYTKYKMYQYDDEYIY